MRASQADSRKPAKQFISLLLVNMALRAAGAHSTAGPPLTGRALLDILEPPGVDSSSGSLGTSAQTAYGSWQHPAHPRIFVQEVPEKFCPGAANDKAGARGYGFKSLNEPLSIEFSIWNSYWHANDLWFADQFRTSPLRVYNETEADLVFVPICLAISNRALHVSPACTLRAVVGAFQPVLHFLTGEEHNVMWQDSRSDHLPACVILS